MPDEPIVEPRTPELGEEKSVQVNGHGTADSSSAALGIGVGCSVWVFIGCGLGILLSKNVRDFMHSWWWAVLLGLILFWGLLAWPSVRKHTTTKTRVWLIIFVVVPMSLALIGAVIFVPQEYQVPAVRAIFLVVVCLLPAILYYLFITTAKFSILNEFVTNLDRLGLLARVWDAEQTSDQKDLTPARRLETYIRKFEAVYGALPFGDRDRLVKSPDPSSVFGSDSKERPGVSGLASIFTSETRIPVVVCTILVALGWLLVLVPWEGDGDLLDRLMAVSWSEALSPKGTPVQFAFLGAYFFSIQMLFRRYVRRDLRASAYVAVSLRIILAVIGIWVVVEAFSVIGDKVATGNALLVVGFVVGAFPPVVWQVIQAALKKIGPAVVLPSLQPEMPLSELDGLTVWHQSRLEEEDIENVPNMATADVVELMLHTRFAPDRIVDWVDQAALYTYLGPEQQDTSGQSTRQKLRAHGIRTASALVEIYRNITSTDERDLFEKILGGTGYSPVRSLVESLETNPNLRLIQTWRNTGRKRKSNDDHT